MAGELQFFRMSVRLHACFCVCHKTVTLLKKLQPRDTKLHRIVDSYEYLISKNFLVTLSKTKVTVTFTVTNMIYV